MTLQHGPEAVLSPTCSGRSRIEKGCKLALAVGDVAHQRLQLPLARRAGRGCGLLRLTAQWAAGSLAPPSAPGTGVVAAIWCSICAVGHAQDAGAGRAAGHGLQLRGRWQHQRRGGAGGWNRPSCPGRRAGGRSWSRGRGRSWGRGWGWDWVLCRLRQSNSWLLCRALRLRWNCPTSLFSAHPPTTGCLTRVANDGAGGGLDTDWHVGNGSSSIGQDSGVRLAPICLSGSTLRYIPARTWNINGGIGSPANISSHGPRK